MARVNKKLTAAVETYFEELRRIYSSGGGTGERSNYPALANLLNAVGATLKPNVFCVSELADQGSGHPDFGLYTKQQMQKGRPRKGQMPERGVVEVKSARESMQTGAVHEQVMRYWGRYRLVLETNLHEFVLIGPKPNEGGGGCTRVFTPCRQRGQFLPKVRKTSCVRPRGRSRPG